MGLKESVKGLTDRFFGKQKPRPGESEEEFKRRQDAENNAAAAAGGGAMGGGS